MKILKPLNYYKLGLQVFIPAVSLFFGGMIYIIFRDSEYVFYKWIRFIDNNSLIFFAKDISETLKIVLPDWIVYSMPSGLWAFAYTFIIVVLWFTSHSIARYFWYTSIPLLIFGFEFMQYFKIVPGTLSIGDILTSLGGLLLGIYLGLRSSKT